MTAVLEPAAGVDVADYAVKAALKAGADEAQVSHSFSELFEVTYDNTDIGLVRTTVNDQVGMTFFVNGAKGQSSITGRSNDLMEQAAAEAVAAARAGVADPANGVFDGDPTPLVQLGHLEPDADNKIDAIKRHQEYVAENYPLIKMRDSTYEFGNVWRSFVNSKGLQHQERRSGYTVSAIFSAKDGQKATSFNYTGATAVDPFAEIRDAATLVQLLSDTMASFDPKSVPETFVGDVIFTSDSAPTFISTVLGSLSGYTLMRGTSPFQESLGQVVADTRLSIHNRTQSAAFPLASTFDSDGVPTADRAVINNGVLENHLIDWYTSRKLGRDLTGGMSAIDVAPGDQSLDDIIANTKRGIILGRYSGGQPNQQLDFSGVAKNSFYVEDGKVQFAINETMIAGNFAELLKNIRAIGSSAVNFGSRSYPAIAVTGVTISRK
jgi:PmbA protein